VFCHSRVSKRLTSDAEHLDIDIEDGVEEEEELDISDASWEVRGA
jgi:hypothetical protein